MHGRGYMYPRDRDKPGAAAVIHFGVKWARQGPTGDADNLMRQFEGRCFIYALQI